jgi:hypothetical protein
MARVAENQGRGLPIYRITFAPKEMGDDIDEQDGPLMGEYSRSIVISLENAGFRRAKFDSSIAFDEPR